MSRIARALHSYCIGRPCRVIPSGGAPYMIRVYLGHWRGWRLYLHRFVSSDGERWLHDHPFAGLAVVLSGGYVEEVLPALGLLKDSAENLSRALAYITGSNEPGQPGSIYR